MKELDKNIAVLLLSWYREKGRVLPWRSDPAPYHVWVSEIMLQQTRVETVRTYYQRFIARLPDIASLAECPEEELLKLWEGLGYYSRVRNMKRAAVICMQEYDGMLPDDQKLLAKLPGIGSYTSGAIVSIAYGQRVPAVDGNVLRIVSRLTECDDDILKESTRRETEQMLMDILPEDAPGDFNQALMDLGAMICLGNAAPLCSDCPLNNMCLACAHQSTDRFPVRAKAKSRKVSDRRVLILSDGTKVLLVRRPSSGLLAGLYEYLCTDSAKTAEEVERETGTVSLQEADEINSQVRSLGLEPVRMRPLGNAIHLFSHVEWHMKGYLILVEELVDTRMMRRAFPDGYVIADMEKISSKLPLPSAYAAYTKALQALLPERAE